MKGGLDSSTSRQTSPKLSFDHNDNSEKKRLPENHLQNHAITTRPIEGYESSQISTTINEVSGIQTSRDLVIKLAPIPSKGNKKAMIPANDGDLGGRTEGFKLLDSITQSRSCKNINF